MSIRIFLIFQHSHRLLNSVPFFLWFFDLPYRWSALDNFSPARQSFRFYILPASPSFFAFHNLSAIMKVETAAVALLFATTSVAAPSGRLSEKTIKEDPDFGLCIPTMKFEGGLGGRSAGDFTFLPTDPLCARGQQEALNPSISFPFEVLNIRTDKSHRHHHQQNL